MPLTSKGEDFERTHFPDVPSYVVAPSGASGPTRGQEPHHFSAAV